MSEQAEAVGHTESVESEDYEEIVVESKPEGLSTIEHEDGEEEHTSDAPELAKEDSVNELGAMPDAEMELRPPRENFPILNFKSTVPRLCMEEATSSRYEADGKSGLRWSPPRTRGYTVHNNVIGDGEEGEVLGSVTSRCSLCGKTFPSKAEMWEHQRANHKDYARRMPKIHGTLLCAHPHCGMTFPDMRHLVAHLCGFHNQQQYRVRRHNFASLEGFEQWKENMEKNSKSSFLCRKEEEQVAPGVIQFEMYCECCDEWMAMDKTKDPSKAVIGCPAHITVTVDRNKNKVTAIGCLAHLGHLKKAHWSIIPDNSYLRQRGVRHNLAKQIKCNICGEWFRSRAQLSSHRRAEHPATVKMPSILCGDPDCDVICETMLALCEHVADCHKREDLVIEEYKFNSLQEFEMWRERMETDTMAHFSKVSGRQRGAAHGINADCYFRYYQCHLSGFVVKPTQHRVDPSMLSNRPKQRNRGTKKLGRFCTAFMNIKINESDGTVLMKGCLGHFGHETDVRKLPLPAAVRVEMADLLQKGYSEDDVLHTIKSKSSPLERAHYLQKYEVRNLVKKLIKESNGNMYYKYDDEEEEEIPATSWARRPYSMFRPNGKRRSTSTWEMQFRPAVARKRRLVFRGEMMKDEKGMLYDEEELEQLDELHVGAEEEYFDGEYEYEEDTKDIGTHYERKLNRIPLLKDSSATRHFDSVLLDIQNRIRMISNQLKITKDVRLAANMLEQVKALEGRMSEMVGQTAGPAEWGKKNGHEEQYYEELLEEDYMLEEEEGQLSHPQYDEVIEEVYTSTVTSPHVEVVEEDVDVVLNQDVLEV